MATSPESRPTHELKTTTSDEDEHHEAGWKTLFGFTTRKHLLVVFSGLFAAFIAALTMPAMALLLSFIFNQFSDYAVGKISGPALLHNASTYCIYLTAVCVLCWFSNSIYFTLFLAFGELLGTEYSKLFFERTSSGLIPERVVLLHFYLQFKCKVVTGVEWL